MKSTKNEMEHFNVGYNEGLVEGYHQGKSDGAREFAEWLLVNHTLDCIECNSGDKSIGCKECANEYIAEWQKGKENEIK